jgi:hypothetical protein
MRSLLLEEFILLAPDPANGNMREIYQRPFRSQHITAHFEGWAYDAPYALFVDHTEERNMVWFGTGTYFINGQELRWPPTCWFSKLTFMKTMLSGPLAALRGDCFVMPTHNTCPDSSQ